MQAEDVSLFRRKDRRTLALYPSIAKLAARGRFYSDDALRDYDVLDYNVDAAIDPERQTIQGRARLAIRVRATSVSTVLLRLNEALEVSESRASSTPLLSCVCALNHRLVKCRKCSPTPT